MLQLEKVGTGVTVADLKPKNNHNAGALDNPFDRLDCATKSSETQEKGNDRRCEMTAFLCDECCAPLSLYGENYIESYANGRANIMRCLCDLHAEEFLGVIK